MCRVYLKVRSPVKGRKINAGKYREFKQGAPFYLKKLKSGTTQKYIRFAHYFWVPRGVPLHPKISGAFGTSKFFPSEPGFQKI
jgi:hypothetical protein